MIHNAILIRGQDNTEKALLDYYTIQTNQNLLLCIMWHICILQKGIYFVLPGKPVYE